MMEGDATMVRIDRKSSIETEPRTLTIDQIKFAREAALYVVNTSSIEDALSTFTEGLEPVLSVARRNGDAINTMEMSREMQYLEDKDDDEMQLPGITRYSICSFLIDLFVNTTFLYD